ncbi:MAG: protein-disulfide reductase DsbD [Zoogloeaceae bacterium]|jgi:thiol:disulfide interchange protein DsbD|nr:protein-disulfide reductase DsbD [Zoogloeaceae bacterium]
MRRFLCSRRLRFHWRFLMLLAGFLSGAFSTLTLYAQEFLDPAVAFRVSIAAQDGQTLAVRFAIAPGYYLYRDKFRFSSADGPRLGAAEFPPGKVKEDEIFGRVEVHDRDFTVRLPVERNASGALRFSLLVTFQGCAEAGLCYPPQTTTLLANLPAASALTALPGTTGDAAGDAPAVSPGNDESRIAERLRTGGFLANLLAFFLAGLLLAFTPCVLPMLPILSSIIVGQGKQVSRKTGFALSLAYVLGMALAYAGAGVAAGLTGNFLAAALQNAWVLVPFAAIFVLLAFSMFGFYSLQLPAALQGRLAAQSGSIAQRPGLRGLAVFLMGAVSALIVSPCVAAPLAGALLYIGKTGDAFLGGAALFTMALGMGVPLLLIGLSAGTLLPRSGPWMKRIKQGFGVLLLLTAVWLLVPVIPAFAVMLADALILMFSALHLRALEPLPPEARSGERFWKGIGILLFLTGVSLFIGLLGGSRDPLQPLAVFQQRTNPEIPVTTATSAAPVATPVAEIAADVPAFAPITSLDELEQGLSVARSRQQAVLIDFYADWCRDCKEMERLTFADPAIRERLRAFQLFRVDVTANRAQDKALLQRFQLFGPPGIIFFDADGKERAEAKVVGFKNAEAFAKALDGVGSVRGESIH